ncbi:polysaccharide biosynthesis tyrosine autokinase [Chryseobacterium sp. RR2-3-20]|uniref:GumC family protein n=1 Tax=Chryseobacterium sp. RR2-3-20 TaxID=2787626 RepID=UPI001AE06EE7|nr:polysaccharide biosynthesis tyrosine autokinase [Chryseobacterium sp. RR2-3-20]
MDHNSKKEINIKELLSPYLRNWKYFVTTVFLALVGAVFYIKSKSPVFKVQTSVLIKDAKKMSAASGDVGVLQSLGGFGGMGTNSIENEVGVFASKTIVEDVLKELNFQTVFYARQTLKDIELYGETNPYIINVVQEKENVLLPKKPISIKTKGNTITLSSEEFDKDIVTSFNKTTSLPFGIIIISKNPKYKAPFKVDMSDIIFYYTSFDGAVDGYQRALKVDLLDKDGTIITLSVDFENTAKAKDFLDRLVRQYNVYAINDKNIESKKTKDFIDQRIVLISKELGDVESQKQDFKSGNNIVDLPTEARINLQTKEQSKVQMLELATQMELSKFLRSSLNKKGTGDVLPLNIGLENEAALNAIQQYNALVVQRNKYLQEATPNNPIVKDMNEQIDQMKSSLSESLQRNVTSLELARRKVETQLGGSESMISKIPFQEKLFRSIERQQQIKENLYLLLLQKREEAAISLEITADKARVIDKAFVFSNPVAPKKPLILAVCLVFAVFIPFLIIYLKNILTTTISRRSDITKLTDVPVLAEIPILKKSENALLSFNDVSPMAEAFRIFVTNLKFLLPVKDAQKIIMVTSSVKGEGKTFISSNLSLILASSRDKVLVIGADIRNPQLQRYNPSMRTAKGLTEFLAGDDSATLENIIHPSGYNENCDFIYSGSIPPNPTELLQNGRLDELFSQLKNQNKYKFIVLDTAPLMLVTDSILIANKSDVIVYVTRAGVTEKDYLEFLKNAVEDKKIANVGIVLNGVEESNFGYGNKFGYGYQATKTSWWKRK